MRIKIIHEDGTIEKYVNNCACEFCTRPFKLGEHIYSKKYDRKFPKIVEISGDGKTVWVEMAKL